MKMEDALKLKNGWFKVMTDPHMETDFWPPSDSINYVEFDKEKRELRFTKEWNKCYRVIEKGRSAIDDNYIENINLIPVGFDVEKDPKDKRIDDILYRKDKFIV
jgi:hypothetical protein